MLAHGRFVMTQVPQSGYNEEGNEESTMEYPRRRTMAEPTLPILPECPSQENSSVSRMDMSVHSGRDNDTETIHSQNTSIKGSAAFHSNYTLSRADAPDIIIENYNITECVDNVSNKRRDSVSSRNISSSTQVHGGVNNLKNKQVTSSCSFLSSNKPITNSKSPTAGDIVNGLVDVNGDIMFMDAESNETGQFEQEKQTMNIGEDSSSSEIDCTPYFESIV